MTMNSAMPVPTPITTASPISTIPVSHSPNSNSGSQIVAYGQAIPSYGVSYAQPHHALQDIPPPPPYDSAPIQGYHLRRPGPRPGPVGHFAEKRPYHPYVQGRGRGREKPFKPNKRHYERELSHGGHPLGCGDHPNFPPRENYQGQRSGRQGSDRYFDRQPQWPNRTASQSPSRPRHEELSNDRLPAGIGPLGRNNHRPNTEPPSMHSTIGEPQTASSDTGKLLPIGNRYTVVHPPDSSVDSNDHQATHDVPNPFENTSQLTEALGEVSESHG